MDLECRTYENVNRTARGTKGYNSDILINIMDVYID